MNVQLANIGKQMAKTSVSELMTETQKYKEIRNDIINEISSLTGQSVSRIEAGLAATPTV